MNHVKRAYAYNHNCKIVCIKHGHECLFPNASELYYEWQDISDELKAGIIHNKREDEIKTRIIAKYGNSITFLSPSDTSWDEKKTIAQYSFIPINKHNHNLNADIIIAPRSRTVDPKRNWQQRHWQFLIRHLNRLHFKVGVIGSRGTTYNLSGVSVNAYDYVDIDTDIELIHGAKLIITQESGMAYLTYMCKKPIIIIDRCHRIIADLHRDKKILFIDFPVAWKTPLKLVKLIRSTIKDIPDRSRT
jgi:hypothetical protein